MRNVAAALVVVLGLFGSCADGKAADLRYFEDATLRALHFHDARQGWAVGDEGVIWRTIDGGQNWERQITGLRASLRSVVFLNAFVGWVAGREELPHGRGSTGVLLFTRDGGETWKRLLPNALPGLNQVKFLDPQNGLVLGDSNDQFATGVFRTTDGGRTWEPVPGPRGTSWLTGDFQDGKTGILAGAWGQLAKLRDDTFAKVDVDDLGGRSVRALTIMAGHVVAVAEGGLILTSQTGGARYGFADLKLPTDVLACLDFNAIHSVGKKAWVVGRPGSVLLHTDDSGVTWKLHKTGQALPLHGVYFLDEKNGWAAGELGTILHTSDGGQSWKTQQQGRKRAALLTVHAQPEEVPLDTLALLGADEGYVLASLRLFAPDPASAAPVRSGDAARFADAARRAGAATGEMLWQFPLPQHLSGIEEKHLLEHWNKTHANQASRELLRQLVLSLRLWRPEVLVTNHPGGKNFAASLVGQALVEAIKQAADAKSFPEQIEALGLAPWRVKKLYFQWDKNDAQVAHDNNEARPRLEASLRDFAAAAARLLCDSPNAVPGQRFYKLIQSAVEGAERQNDLMLGLSMAVGDTRRQRPKEAKGDPEVLKGVVASRNLLSLADKLDDANQAATTLAQIGPALAGLPEDQGARAAFAIASQYARKGQWTLAREAYLLMVDRYPAHPLAVDAYRWLIRHVSSGEARRRHELGQFYMVSQVRYNPALNSEPKSGDVQQVKGSDKVASGQVTYLSNKDQTRRWFEGSLEIGKRLSAFGPLYASDPAIQMCLQSSRRQLGDFAAAQEWYNRFRTFGPRGPYSDAAAGELWLANRGQAPPRRIALCRLAGQKPYLDGNLDDGCWQGLKPLVLGSVTDDPENKRPREGAAGQDVAKDNPTEAWFAYDQEFLYVALRCKHPKGLNVPAVKDRTRDAPLDSYDRVSILLDMDRDYSTYYRLEVDQRGCVREDCWGDATWNPRWFVAVKSDDSSWVIEAAIPLSELTGDRLTAGSAWAINVVRTLPGRGVLAWSLPADVEPRPEGMSLMLFQQEVNGKDRPKAESKQN